MSRFTRTQTTNTVFVRFVWNFHSLLLTYWSCRRLGSWICILFKELQKKTMFNEFFVKNEVSFHCRESNFDHKNLRKKLYWMRNKISQKSTVSDLLFKDYPRGVNFSRSLISLFENFWMFKCAKIQIFMYTIILATKMLLGCENAKISSG